MTLAASSALRSTFNALPAAPASAVKREGWRAMMRRLAANGRLVVTNHNHPEAVILSTAEYTRLLAAAAGQSAPDPLAGLRQQFDERLATLNAPDAGDRLRSLIQQPAALGGKVLAGSPH
jgi:PHD/YefM family antitoxin component YafN of YafNO toxin-antitoxin module